MEDIKNYTILNLKKMARQNNYTGYTKMNKLDLYNFLNSKNIDNTTILQPIKGIPKPNLVPTAICLLLKKTRRNGPGVGHPRDLILLVEKKVHFPGRITQDLINKHGC